MHKVKIRKLSEDELIEEEEVKYFKQININDKIRFCETYPGKKKIKVTSSTLNVKNLKLIDTICGESIEGQKLTGKKLIICGQVDIKFRINTKNKKICEKKSIPVSTFIVLPKEICREDTINLNYLIEDITIIGIEKDLIFISITIFLYID